MKTIEQIQAELDQKIPRSAVAERSGGGGRSLSYLTAHYVIDRLNQVFGHLNWNKEILEIKEVVNKTSKGEFPAYLVKLRLTVSVFSEDDQKSVYVVKEAYGYGADKSDQNAHELAIKEAVSDALKVAAKDLGMSMGLALYDKDQVNVEEEPEASKPAAPSPTTITNKATVSALTPKDSGAAAPRIAEAPAAKATTPDRTKLLETTGSKAMVLQKVKGKTIDEVKGVLTTMFGSGRTRQDLSVSELQQLDAEFDKMLA